MEAAVAEYTVTKWTFVPILSHTYFMDTKKIGVTNFLLGLKLGIV